MPGYEKHLKYVDVNMKVTEPPKAAKEKASPLKAQEMLATSKVPLTPSSSTNLVLPHMIASSFSSFS